MSCAKEQLSVAQLNPGEVMSTAGVTGCGHKATYVLVHDNFGVKWVLNAVDGTTAKEAK